MRAVPEGSKFVIADQDSYSADLACPNPRGWYHSVANVVSTAAGLVAVYRLSDSHTAVSTHIMVAYSRDRGRSWFGHRSISHRNVWEHGSVWIAPQLSRLRDGRLVIICDQGSRGPGDDWPRLAFWQRPPRGMANYLFWSLDNGLTWNGPQQCDQVGGEPGYVVDLADGTLVYTRTEAVEAEQFECPPPPGHSIYHRNTAVFSDDGGRSWNRTATLTDDPYHGDAEVGIVELEPGRLLAVTRIGYGNGDYGQPSRIVRSHDGGRTWEEPQLAPFYGQRTAVHKLRSGKLLVTYRNRWGTFASYAFVWDPHEEFGFQPASFIWREHRCQLKDGVLVLDTGCGEEDQVFFSLYPALSGRARVELEAELRLAGPDGAGCDLYAGCHLRVTPHAVLLAETGGDAHQPSNYMRFPIDCARWRSYRVLRADGELAIWVDGQQLYRGPSRHHARRLVRFGSNRPGLSLWRRVSACVRNPQAHGIDWSWDAASGAYPDQLRRDRMVRLDASADSGYSNWDQMDDGSIVIADYSNDAFHDATWRSGSQPAIKAYVVTEEELT